MAADPTNSGNGKQTNLEGLITSVSATASSFNVQASDGLSWSISTSGSTVFQGVAGFSALAAGLPVDMDAAIQVDGSLLATRVVVADAEPVNVTTWRGPLLYVGAGDQALSVMGVEEQGQLFAGLNGPGESDIGNELGEMFFSLGSALFQTSAQFANLQNLPFHADFNAANMVAGQNAYVTTHDPTFPDAPNYVSAATVTLIPQIINGTVTGISSDGGFTTYMVALAGYDLFPILAQLQGQTTLLQTPGSVVVYADSGTQMLTSTAPAVGGVLRFNGLVFNDNGTLRMACTEVLDGVAP